MSHGTLLDQHTRRTQEALLAFVQSGRAVEFVQPRRTVIVEARRAIISILVRRSKETAGPICQSCKDVFLGDGKLGFLLLQATLAH